MKFPFQLRPDQQEALSCLEQNHHLIFSAPTGSGKSTIFQKFIFDRPQLRAILISPLNALSRQQAERFESLGISTFHHQMPQWSEVGVWIMSPEKVQGRTFENLARWKPEFLIVDEAHCVWEWGKDFRPSFRRVLQLCELPSIRKTMWCSATLAPQHLNQLQHHLNSLSRNKVKRLGSFSLPKNLKLSVEKISPELRPIWLRNRLGLYADESGMIFCNTRASAMNLQKHLTIWGIRSFFYHAGLSLEEKLALEKRLGEHSRSGIPIVVVATSAFGMGMDYDFFSFCIIYEPSFTLLSLVQAVGRVGRSKSGETKPAAALVLWHPDDFQRNQAWIDQSEVEKWCVCSENPAQTLENYFNGFPLSGSMRIDEFVRQHSNRSTAID